MFENSKGGNMMFSKIQHAASKAELGPIQDDVIKDRNGHSRNREPLTLAITSKLKQMRVNQSFLINVKGKKHIEAMRARVFAAAKDADCGVATRTRTEEANGEVGLRVWKERKKQSRRFTLSDK
tara:strand:+ start:3009 stop:3380 length:372 start_codon:yes stop_codon:yes gene_type:complete